MTIKYDYESHSHDFMYFKFIRACETLDAKLAIELAFTMKCPDVFSHIGILCEALQKISGKVFD